MKLFVCILFSLLTSGCTKNNAMTLPDVNNNINLNTDTALTYLALGDSYTIGEAVPQSASFPYQLRSFLKDRNIVVAEPKVIATTGWTTDELSHAIQNAKLTAKFDFVTLLIGVNNQYRGYPLATYKKEFLALLQTAISFAKGNRKHVYVLSIPDWGKTPFGLNSSKNVDDIAKEIDLFNDACKAITLAEGVSYTDITPISRRGLAEPDLVAGDGLHPGAKMYGAWVKLLAPKVMEQLK